MAQSKQALFEHTRARFTTAVYFVDLCVLLAGLCLAYYIRFDLFGDLWYEDSYPLLIDYWNQFCLALIVFSVVAHNQKLYRWKVVISRARMLTGIVKLVAIWSFSVVGLTLMLGFSPPLSRFFMVCAVVVLLVLLSIWRVLAHFMLHHFSFFDRAIQDMAIVGTNAGAQDFAKRLRAGHCGLYRFSGFIATSNTSDREMEDLADELLGPLGNIDALTTSGKFHGVAVADVDLKRSELVRVAKVCEMNYIDFKAIPKSFEVLSSCLQINSMGGVPVMTLTEVPQNRLINRLVKRVVDGAGALVGLAISLPVFAILIPLIKRESPGPVLYRQTRVGQGGKEFTIYKLRSMKLDAEAEGAPGWSTQIDPRRLKIGSFMRKWNLDELPQFWNVLKGDMSLVGPRPERPELINDFIKEIPYYQSRHSVKPGMTGWAQVHGLRGDTSISERIRYDLHYIENWSIWTDLTIQFKTFFNYKGAC